MYCLEIVTPRIVTDTQIVTPFLASRKCDYLTDTLLSEKVRYTTEADRSVHFRFAQLFIANFGIKKRANIFSQSNFILFFFILLLYFILIIFIFVSKIERWELLDKCLFGINNFDSYFSKCIFGRYSVKNFEK